MAAGSLDPARHSLCPPASASAVECARGAGSRARCPRHGATRDCLRGDGRATPQRPGGAVRRRTGPRSHPFAVPRPRDRRRLPRGPRRGARRGAVRGLGSPRRGGDVDGGALGAAGRHRRRRGSLRGAGRWPIPDLGTRGQCRGHQRVRARRHVRLRAEAAAELAPGTARALELPAGRHPVGRHPRPARAGRDRPARGPDRSRLRDAGPCPAAHGRPQPGRGRRVGPLLRPADGRGRPLGAGGSGHRAHPTGGRTPRTWRGRSRAFTW